tara:strand:+ start:201 stop:1154 length:954 start_codon:yes stop_codon:yes gene_type:complete
MRGLLTTNKSKLFALHLLFFWSRSWLTLLILLVIFVLRRLNGMPIDLLDWVAILFFLLPVPLALWAMLSSNIETQLSALAVRGRWDEIRARMPRYHEQVAKAMGEPKAGLATALWTARALYRQENEHEANEALEQARLADGIDEADYQLALIQFQMFRNEYETARDSAQLLVELAPDRIEGWLSICEIDAVYLDDGQSARIALDEAMLLDTWKNLGPMTNYVTGVTLAAEGAHKEAIAMLEKFRAWALSYATQNSMTLSFRACAGCIIVHSLDAIGRQDEADQLLESMLSELEDGAYLEITKQLNHYMDKHPRATHI